MATFAIQFHALTDELATFVADWIREFGVYATALDFPPFRARSIEPTTLREEFERETMGSVMITENAPRLALSQSQLLDDNYPALMVDIGRLGDRGLKESCLSTMLATPRWKAISNDLKKRTRAGAWAINSFNGATSFNRNHRYTPGAKAISEAGKSILALGGHTSYRLGKEPLQ